MSTEPTPRDGQTSKSRNNAAATVRRTEADDGSVLFHPLCVPRLETAIQRSRRNLVAASQAAASGIEKSIALLAEDPAVLEADQLGALTAALSRSLRALRAIETAAGGPVPVSREDQTALDRSVRLLLEAADRIAGPR